jgi:alcohol dehydrogenase
MNIFNIIRCRFVHLTFKILLPFLPYKNPIVYEDIINIKDVLNTNNASKVLIVTGPHIYQSGLVNILLDELNKNKIDYVVFKDTCSNPLISVVDKATLFYKNNNCDSIIAFGGGSPLDVAKLVGAKVATNKEIIKLKGVLKVRHKIPLLIAIPTTAGSGSEVTLAAVITDDKTHLKFAVNDFNLIPKYVFLLNKTTSSLPKKTIATCGMDALTHALESYLNIGGDKQSKKDALEASKLIFSNLENCYLNNDDISRINMLKASFLAGRSFSKGYVGYVHALAHGFGGIYNYSHGELNAIILPYVLEYYGKSIYKKIYKIGLYCSLCSKEDSYKDGYFKVLNKIKQMNEEFNIPSKIENVKYEDIEIIAKRASKEANPLYPCPKLMSKRELSKFIKEKLV